MTDVDIVGGKNASLGEMISQLSDAGVKVPGGFATTAQAFREFLTHNRLTERIADRLAGLNIEDVKALAQAGAEIRSWVREAAFPPAFEEAIRTSFGELTAAGSSDMSFAVRSSATAEDLPDASFAGQQETVLNVVGIDAILGHILEVFASLYNDRAISYRVHQGFAHEGVALSAGVQRMCRSDLGAAGVSTSLRQREMNDELGSLVRRLDALAATLTHIAGGGDAAWLQGSGTYPEEEPAARPRKGSWPGGSR